MNDNVEALIAALREIDDGLLLQECGDKLAEAVQVARKRNKKAGIQISLGLKPNQYGQVEVVGRVEIGLPKSDSYGAIMYTTEEGHLTRRDPRQPELPGMGDDDEEDYGSSAARRWEKQAAEKVQKGKKIVPIAPSAAS